MQKDTVEMALLHSKRALTEHTQPAGGDFPATGISKICGLGTLFQVALFAPKLIFLGSFFLLSILLPFPVKYYLLNAIYEVLSMKYYLLATECFIYEACNYGFMFFQESPIFWFPQYL